MKEIFETLWKLALPYQDKRDDKGYAKTVLDYAIRLAELEDSGENIVVPAAILHDIGWSKILKEESLKIFESKIGEDERIKIQRYHEEIGVKLAKEILEKANYNPELIHEILEIISRHDTGKGFISKNEGIARDADKLWRFSEKCFWADVKRRNNAPKEEYEKLKSKIDSSDFFYSENARKIARKELEKRKREFLIGRIRISSKKGAEPPAVRKAQASMEFLMLVIVTMIFVIIVYAANLNKMGEVSSTSRQQELEAGCERLSSAINEAYYFGNGFSRNATAGGNYTIRISNSTLICYDSSKNFISTIVPSDVRNSTGGATFEIKTGLQSTFQIENKGYIVIR